MQEIFLVSDANVLIDYYKSNPNLLKILCNEYKVIVPQVIIDEIEEFSREEAIHAGFHRVNSKTYHKTKPIGGEVI